METVSISDCLVVLLVCVALVLISLNVSGSPSPSISLPSPRNEAALESSGQRETDPPLSLAGAEKDAKENRPNESFAHFLEAFPAQREEIEKCIRCLRDLADKIHKTHKDCTIASITASSTGAVSGILTILGLALTPVTAGGSLILSATGIGLGAAAATTGVSAGLCEHFINSKKGEEAQVLVDQCENSLRTLVSQIDLSSGLPPLNDKAIQEIFQHVAAGAQQIPKLIGTVRGITANVEALKCIRANPGLKALAKRAAATGSTSRASMRGVKQVEKAFKGTALAMTKGARVAGAILTGVTLLLDACSIIQDAIHLTKGAKAEAADGIKAKANNLEEVLQKLSKLYRELNELEE